MITDVSKATVLVVDHGCSVELALRLAEDYAKVYYCPGTSSAYPTMAEERVGEGFKEIEVIASPFKVLDKIDLAVFPDVNDGPLQVHFAEKLQIPVWGSRLAEQLEIDRVFMKELMAKLKLPLGEWDEVEGITALREYIRKHPDIYVKMSRYRGDWETTHYDTYDTAKNDLDKFEHRMGLFAEVAKFECENPLKDKIEFGRDNFTVSGKWPKRALIGIERKDMGYAGVVKDDDDLPEYVHRFDTAMEPVFKRLHYNGDVSTEIRVGRDKIPFMIDLCARRPNPPGYLMMEHTKNISKVILMGSQGVLIEPEFASKYGVEVIIYADAASEGDPVTVEFPEDIRQFCKFRNLIKIKGRYQIQPGRLHYPQVGSVLGLGDTLKEAQEMAEEVADEVKGSVKINLNALEEAQKEIEKAKEMGLNIF